MVALYVILALLALIICLLFTNIEIAFSYKEHLSLKVKYLITVFNSEKDKKVKSTKKKSSKKQEKRVSPIRKLEEYFKSYDSTIAFFELLKELLVKFSKFLKNVRVFNTQIDLTVAGEDAASTAIKYGACCAVVYPVFTLLSKTVKFTPKSINVTSDFTAERFSLRIYTDLSVKPIYVIIFALSLAFSYIKLRIERNKK